MTFKRRLISLIFLIIIIVSPLISQQDNIDQTQIQDESELIILDEETPALFQDQDNLLIERSIPFFGFWDVVRMILILGFVIACIYGLFFVLKKAGTQKFNEDSLITIISSKSIAAGKALHIVEVGNHVMVIGAAENSISALLEITDKETIDNIKLHKAEVKKPVENSFQQYLVNMFFKGKGNKEGKNDISFDHFKKQRDRIEKM